MKTTLERAPGRDDRDGLRATSARERDEERDEPDELWATAVAQTLVERLPRLTLPETPLAAHPSPSARGATAPASGAGTSALPDAEGDGKNSASDARGVPAELRAEVSDERLGRLSLHVARAEAGLDIVISVADSSVKALIEAEHENLVKTLEDAGLHVATVRIGSPPRAGTTLAVERGGPEKPRLGPGYHKPGARRTYPGSLEEADDRDGLDLEA